MLGAALRPGLRTIQRIVSPFKVKPKDVVLPVDGLRRHSESSSEEIDKVSLTLLFDTFSAQQLAVLTTRKLHQDASRSLPCSL